MTTKLKVMTFVGTRPEIIRLSRTITLLDSVFHHVLVHTGQNYDFELNEIFFDELGLRAPDILLESDTGSLGRLLGSIIERAERAILVEKPDAVLILGDTNSSIAAVIAKRMRVPVFHMEAGNRSYDERVPEEVNRKLVDHIADFNLVYTEHARTNLLREGIHPSRIMLTGSPMREVLDHYSDHISKSDVLDRLGLNPERYFVASIHRAETVDDPVRLNDVIDALGNIGDEYEVPVVVSTHPRTRARLQDRTQAAHNRLQFHRPFGFFDYIKLQRHARCVLSDSGTVSEESYMLDFPAVTLRDAIERPEAVDAGSITLTGTDPVRLSRGVATTLAVRKLGRRAVIPEYEIGNTSTRVALLISSSIADYAHPAV